MGSRTGKSDKYQTLSTHTGKNDKYQKLSTRTGKNDKYQTPSTCTGKNDKYQTQSTRTGKNEKYQTFILFYLQITKIKSFLNLFSEECALSRKIKIKKISVFTLDSNISRSHF